MPNKCSDDIHTENGRTVSCKLNHVSDSSRENEKVEETKKHVRFKQESLKLSSNFHIPYPPVEG